MIKFSERFYRESLNTGRWTVSSVRVDSTDLYLYAESDLSELCRRYVIEYREQILDHISRQPDFIHSYSPVERLGNVAPVIASMYDASEAAKVGPMAAIAGAINSFVARGLEGLSRELIIENGGDIWMKLEKSVVVDIFSGNPKFSGRALLKIKPEETPCAVCTSSGKIGPSFSYGRADSVTIIARDSEFADAAATAVCSMVETGEDAAAAAETALTMGASGAVIIIGDILAAAGSVSFAAGD